MIYQNIWLVWVKLVLMLATKNDPQAQLCFSFAAEARGSTIFLLSYSISQMSDCLIIDTGNQQVALRKKLPLSKSHNAANRRVVCTDWFNWWILRVTSYFCSGFWCLGIGLNSWYHFRGAKHEAKCRAWRVSDRVGSSSFSPLQWLTWDFLGSPGCWLNLYSLGFAWCELDTYSQRLPGWWLDP